MLLIDFSSPTLSDNVQVDVLWLVACPYVTFSILLTSCPEPLGRFRFWKNATKQPLVMEICIIKDHTLLDDNNWELGKKLIF